MKNLLLCSFLFLPHLMATSAADRVEDSRKFLNNQITNPSCGCFNWYYISNKIADAQYPSNLHINYGASIYDRLCWKDMIRLGKAQMTSLDALFDTAYCRKVRVDIGIFYSLSMHPEKRFRLRNEQYRGKEVYIAYPEELHDQLISSEKYKPRLVYVPDSDVYWYCIDWRNSLARKKYNELLETFNEYLNLPWKSSTRRKYLSSIQIRFWGFWGEGHNNYLITQYKNKPDVFEDSKTMIKMDRMYQKYFHDIRLIAPAMGKTTNIPDKWKEWALYEMTAKTDVGEFGIFLDHISQASTGDFTLNYKGIDMHNLALSKWTKAPVTGEGNIVNNLIPTREEGRVVRANLPIEQYDIYKYHVSSFLPMKKSYSKEETAIMKSLLNIVGFRLYFVKDSIYLINNVLTVKLKIGNVGLSPVYANYWRLQIVLRDLTGKQLLVIQPNIDVKKIYPGEKLLISDSIDCEIVNNIKSKFPKEANVFLRIIDTDGIAPNMYLYNEDRTINGEYKLN